MAKVKHIFCMKKLKANSSKQKYKQQGFVITIVFFLPLIFLYLLCFSLTMPVHVLAEDKLVSGEKPDWINPPLYKYSKEGKQNPFRSFLRTRDEEEQSKENSKSKAKLGPLQRVAISQLRLVGILWNPEHRDRALAMVELPDGKGFILKMGTKVGRQDGQVVEIKEDRLVIEEEVISVLGEKETRTQVLELHASSGEE